jgi:ribose transport system permease protein
MLGQELAASTEEKSPVQPHVNTSVIGRMAGSGWARILVATAVLFLISGVIQPSSISGDSLAGMLPFAAVLVIAAVGQTLVIQQGGIDLSVAGLVSVTVVVMTKYPAGHSDKLTSAIAISLLIALLAGGANGFFVARVGIPPIVTTLGMGAVLAGGVQQLSGGRPTQTTDALQGFVGHRFGVIPMSVVVAVIVTAIAAFTIKRTVAGRRFEAIGASAEAARAAGLKVALVRGSVYVSAALLYCMAGMVLAGVVNTPSASQGDALLLPSIAAVVLGGTSLLGGRGNVIASALGALFLSQLAQFVLATGASSAVASLVQAAALLCGLALYSFDWGWIKSRLSPPRESRQSPALR